MRIVILDLNSIGNDLDLSALQAFGEVTAYPATPPDRLEERLADAEVVILNKIKLTAPVLEQARGLRLICETATGYDNIDLAACRRLGIAVTNVKGYSTDSVAQLTVAMALSLVTRLKSYTDYVRSGAYTSSGKPNRLSPVYHEIAGMTWGILGYGSIGKRVATVARALGCHVIAVKRTPASDVETVSVEELCRRSDILSVHTPLTPETRGMIGESQLALMKPTAILINVARGAVVDEAALVTALENRQLGGIGCDVYTTEPFGKDSPYTRVLDDDRVCLTPHMAWGGYETRVRLMEEVLANMKAFYNGEKRNRID